MKEVERAIRYIKSLSQQHPWALAFSGGKDSVVLEFLCKEAGIKVDKFYNNTTIDPPGTIGFVQKHGAKVLRGQYSFLDLVEKKGFPTMFRRFCCKQLKERYYADYVFMGIRKNESVKRSKCYSEMESIYYYSKKVFTYRFLPMLNFTEEHIEEIVRMHSLEMHPLYYDENGRFCVNRRLGCIGCPLQGDRGVSDFIEYPILLKQILRRGILFQMRMGRTVTDAALNLVYNLFYSNHGSDKFKKTYMGMFPADPWDILNKKFNITLEDTVKGLPNPKFFNTQCNEKKVFPSPSK